MNCKCDLNDKLEAERHDITFREPKALPVAPCERQHFEKCKKSHNPTCQRPHFTDKAEDNYTKLYFNAGRYAAGARDTVAVAADTKLQELFDK